MAQWLRITALYYLTERLYVFLHYIREFSCRANYCLAVPSRFVSSVSIILLMLSIIINSVMVRNDLNLTLKPKVPCLSNISS